MLYAIVGMLVIILDQGVKYWVTNNIMLNTVTEPLIPGILSLVRMHNDGAAFSFLSGGNARIYFVILTAVFTVAVVIALVTNFINGKFGRWCLVLVTAGALSNCLDRILYGFVVDMFKIDLFDFAVFNVADIFITVFALLFIIYIIFGGEKTKDRDKDEFDEYDDEEADSRSLSGDLRDTVDSVRERKSSKKPRYDDYVEERKRKSGRKAAVEEDPMETLQPMRKPKVVAPAEKRAVPDTTEEAPRKRRSAETEAASDARRARNTFDEEFALSAKPSDNRENAAPARKKVSLEEDDPFAAWEKANAKAEKSSAQTPAAKAMGTAPAKTTQSYAASAPKQTASRPAAAAKPSASTSAPPAPKRAAKSSEDEFSLDDILAEFK